MTATDPNITDHPILIGRLNQQAAFDRLRAMRDPEHRWTAKSLSLQFIDSPHESDESKNYTIKIGISASRKTAKRAVDRNRMKRRLRVASAAIMPNHAAPQRHYLITARSDCLTRSMDEIKDDLSWCLKKLGAYRP